MPVCVCVCVNMAWIRQLDGFRMACCIVLTRWYILRLWMSNTIVLILATFPVLSTSLKMPERTHRTRGKTQRDALFTPDLSLSVSLFGLADGPPPKSWSYIHLVTVTRKRLWLTVWKHSQVDVKYVRRYIYTLRGNILLTFCLKICTSYHQQLRRFRLSSHSGLGTDLISLFLSQIIFIFIFRSVFGRAGLYDRAHLMWLSKSAVDICVNTDRVVSFSRTWN